MVGKGGSGGGLGGREVGDRKRGSEVGKGGGKGGLGEGKTVIK